MKKTLLIIGILAAVTAPVLSARADDAVKSKKSTRTVASKQVVNPVRRDREVYYITKQVVTGSNIPVVVTRYQGHNITSSPFVSYDQTDIGVTGALDVGSALVSRDPAIMLARH